MMIIDQTIIGLSLLCVVGLIVLRISQRSRRLRRIHRRIESVTRCDS